MAAILHVTNNFFALEAAIPFGVFAELIVLVVAYLSAWRFYHQASKEKIVV
jgi:hypothetical protein